MSRDIYVGRKSSRQGYWTSFETDPHHTVGKRNIYGKCVPCMENFLNQLVEGRQEIKLGSASDCWKVVAVLEDEDECLRTLEMYERRFLPSRYIRGRFGSKEERGTKAIVIHTDSKEERDGVLHELEQCAREVNPRAKVFCSRACEYLYGEVLGDWRDWQETTPIKYPQKVSQVISKIKKVLYDED